MFDMGGAWVWARELQTRAVEKGARVIDATLGGGGDTLALCEMVGETGKVYGFDIQSDAVERTRAKLAAAGMLQRAELICASHADMERYVKGEVDAAVFNLGWLPGSDREVTTRTDSTLEAVNAALRLIKPGGLITVCVYPGHAEGARELEALLEWAEGLDGHEYQAMLRRYLNQPRNAPAMLAVTKNPRAR